jgi:hypothetical protein
MPDRMFANLAAGYGGQGTLCGALGVAAQYFNLVAFDQQKTYTKMTEDLFQWYSRSSFPTKRFDRICYFPDQVQVPAKSPLCHVSVSQWTLAAGATVTSKQKKDRCAKVTGEVIYRAVSMLNDYADGRYRPAAYPFGEENAECLGCHGADDMWHDKDGMNNQQGKMTCRLCHAPMFK